MSDIWLCYHSVIRGSVSGRLAQLGSVVGGGAAEAVGLVLAAVEHLALLLFSATQVAYITQIPGGGESVSRSGQAPPLLGNLSRRQPAITAVITAHLTLS